VPPEFGFTKGAHYISAFRAFVSDEGQPGLRLTREDGEYVDVLFSVSAIQELQKQFVEVQQLLSVFPSGKNKH
jgi:hypothetical protein